MPLIHNTFVLPLERDKKTTSLWKAVLCVVFFLLSRISLAVLCRFFIEKMRFKKDKTNVLFVRGFMLLSECEIIKFV